MDNSTDTIPSDSIHPDLVVIPDHQNGHLHLRKKQWCFTLFYVEEGVDLCFPDELPSSCTYLVCQRESCPETRRTHVQGFICFSLAVRFTRAKSLVGNLFRTANSPLTAPRIVAHMSSMRLRVQLLFPSYPMTCTVAVQRYSYIRTHPIRLFYRDWETDRKSTRLNSSHRSLSRMPSSA